MISVSQARVRLYGHKHNRVSSLLVQRYTLLDKAFKTPIQITLGHAQCFARFNSLCEQCTQTGKHYSLMFNPGSHSIYDLTMEHALTIKL